MALKIPGGSSSIFGGGVGIGGGKKRGGVGMTSEPNISAERVEFAKARPRLKARSMNFGAKARTGKTRVRFGP